MTCSQTSKLIADFLAQSLSDKDKAKLDLHLSSCDACAAEFTSLREVWSKFESIPDAEPSTTLQPRFQAMLDAYKAGQAQAAASPGFQERLNQWLERWWPKQPVYQLGLALSVLVCGLFAGFQLRNPAPNDVGALRSEVYGLRQMVATALLNNQSPGERLRGVSFSSHVSDPNPETLQALLDALNYDRNLNVRLAAVDALSQFYGHNYVREGLLESLRRQTSPLIQVALINLLVEQEEKQSISVLNYLQDNEETNQTVRRHASEALEQLQ